MMTMVTANSQTLTERQKAPIEREQSYAGINFAESRQKSSVTQWCEPVDGATYDALEAK